MDELLSLSLRRLRAFLVVAETLHLGRAAERLGIAQPALSQQIRGLEEGLGIRLFHRRKRRIDLTEAGVAYQAEARNLIEIHGASARKVRRIARGELGSLAIGYVPSAMFDDRFPALLRTMTERWPDASLELREGGIADITRAVDVGDIDIALVRAPVPQLADCAYQVASRQRLVAALPADHELARRPSLRVADLKGQSIIGLNDPADLGIMRVVGDIASAAGIELRIGWRVSAMTSVLGLVAGGMGCGIVPEGLMLVQRPGLCFRLLADEQATAEMWYVWRQDRRSALLDQFLRLAS